MTIEEMHIKMEQELFHVDGLDPERIDNILNDQIDKFVRSKLPKKRNFYQEGIDDSTIASKDLETLKVFFHDLGTGNKSAAGSSYILPENCLYPLAFDAMLSYSLTKKEATALHPEKLSPGRFVDFKLKGEVMDNELQKSTYKSPLAVILDGEIRVMEDKSFILKGLYLTYIKKPAKVSITLNNDCDLPESVHNLIVDNAIAYVLENSESERVQTKAAFNQKNE